MRWRDLFRVPAPRPSPAPPAFNLNLASAPAPQPVPVNTAQPADQDVLRLWTIFQRQRSNATWPAFLADLAATNTDLAREIAKLKQNLADYPADSEYRP